MTDTTRPPRRPASARDGRPTSRGGDKPRSRPAGERSDRGSASQRPGEPAPRGDDARIAKVMARAGLCSRRDAESWIAAGRVAVNGKPIDSPALNVGPADRITVDGVALPEREPTRLFLFHKPRGLVTTSRDPEGRPTIFETLPEGLPRVVTVGRLDINTEGLMLLTNDGGLARVLELPATGWMRRYRVRANGEIDQARLDALKGGISVDGVDYAGIEATLDRVQGANAWITMGLREGKNREIKRVLESLGLAVTRLIRLSFGPFQLGDLAAGAVETVPSRVLREQLGPALMAEAGVDLDQVDERPPRAAGRRQAAQPAKAPPSRSNAPAPRPHVSALRAAREEAAAGESRRRTERGATADRKGRAVKVERVVPVGRERGTGESRNARRFADIRQEQGTGRQKTRADAGRVGTRAERPGHDGEASRGDRAGAYGERGRVSRTSDAEARPRPDRARSFDDRPRGPRGRDGADAPRVGEKTFGVRRPGGKPNGRPGGFGSERPTTGRNKSEAASRPFGGGRSKTGGDPVDGGRPSRGRTPRHQAPRDEPPSGRPPSGRPPRGRP